MGVGIRSESSHGALPNHASYSLYILGEERISDISIVSFTLAERAGEPYRIEIVATYPTRLKREVVLGHEARFKLALNERDEPRIWWGRIKRFSHTKTTNDISSYEIVIEAHIGCLNPRTTRTYQNKSAQEIIEAILLRNELRGHQFIFKLRRKYPKHAFRFQYQTGDWRFIQILMQQEGIYSYIMQGKHGDVVVFGDDIDHYIYQPALTAPYREISGLDASEQSVSVLHTHTNLVPQSFLVADYNPDLAWERLKAEANVAVRDTTTFGQPYIYGTHHLSAKGAQWEAELRHEAALAWQVVYEGASDISDLSVGRILRTDADLPDAPHGQVMIEVMHAGGRSQSYRNTYKAIPSDRRFRLKIEDNTWPKIVGSLSARVTSPSKYKYAYLTHSGYYVVRFDCDFGEWPNGGESVPLRLAKPFAGGLNTGFHFPVVDGTEAVIEFRDGDPNKPYIAAFHHNSQQIDLINSQDRWMSRNVIHTQGDNRLQFEDWEQEEHAKLSTRHSGKSQLTLGHIVNGQRQKRGEGFELRTAAYGAVRAGNGLHLTAYNRPEASGKQLDMQETIAQLEKALALARSLADSARASKAEPADTDAQKHTIDHLDQFKEAGVLTSAPGPIGIVSGKSVQVAADDNIQVVAGKGVDMSVRKRFTVAAGELVSLFAQKLGINIFAAQGPIKIQAQSDTLQLAAAQDVTVSSVGGAVYVRAKKELTLECCGAFIQMKNGEITLGAVHGVIVKGPFRKWKPAQMHLAAPAFSPKMTPLMVGCEAWNGSAGRLPISHLPRPKKSGAPASLSGVELGGNPATTQGTSPPAALQASAQGGDGGQTQAVPQAENGPKGLVNADREPRNPLADEIAIPIKLAKSAYCDWSMPDFTAECTDRTETGTYYGLDARRDPYPTPDSRGTRQLSGSQFATAFELFYDNQSKTVYATVRVKLLPVDLYKCDPYGTVLLGPDGQPQSVPFHHDMHWEVAGRGVDSPVGGYVLKYRDKTGSRFDPAIKMRQIEAVLNGHKSKLILNGCSKNDACGCRVSVIFKVELLLAVDNAPVSAGKKNHKTINLFPKTQRADGGSWGEVNMYLETQMDGNPIWKDMPYDTNVIAHECGHLFNYPDEYWQYGGWVHEQYIKNRELDFSLGNENKNKATWQISSVDNVMGGGCNNRIASGARAVPSANVHPYYLEYIRRHFCELTGEAPQYLNDDKTKPIWRRWRVGYDV
jgi:type VI secretion system secreted protein VgrG